MFWRALARRWWIVAGAVVVVLGGLYVFVLRPHRPVALAAAVPEYLAETADSGTFVGQVSVSGVTAAASLATIEVPTAASVSTVSVSLGEHVTAGQTVATLSNGTVVTSPITGRVVGVSASPGAYLTAGSTVATVADMATMYADVSVPEQDVTQVKRGDTVSLTLAALPNKTYTGTVSEVGRQGSAGSDGIVDFPVTIKITHPTNILVGMSVTATITTGKVANAIWVPTAALTVSSGHEAVLVPSTALPTSTFPGFGSGASGFGGFGGGSGGFGSGGGGFGGFGGFGAGGASSRFGVAARRLATTIPRAVDVTVGLTNGTDTEIVGGLTAGEKILVPNPAAASTSGTTAGARPFGGGFGFGGF